MQNLVRGGYSNYKNDKQFAYHAMLVWGFGSRDEELRKTFCYLPVKIVDALLYQGRYSESLEYVEKQHTFMKEKMGEKHHSTLALLFNKARYVCLFYQCTRADFVIQQHQLLWFIPQFKAISECRQKKFSQPVIQNKHSRKVALKPVGQALAWCAQRLVFKRSYVLKKKELG